VCVSDPFARYARVSPLKRGRIIISPSVRGRRERSERGGRLTHNVYFASGSGLNCSFTTLLVVPLPVSVWNGARVAYVVHRPLPFQPVFGSSMRPSSPFA